MNFIIFKKKILRHLLEKSYTDNLSNTQNTGVDIDLV